MKEGGAGHGPAAWAWWAVRPNLTREAKPRQEGLARLLGQGLPPSGETFAFWKFFPLDVPAPMVRSMLRSVEKEGDPATNVGWWFEALRERPNLVDSFDPVETGALPSPVTRLLARTSDLEVSLYEWCAFLRRSSERSGTDPRCGEWTALEVVRQIASLVTPQQVFGPEYIRQAVRPSASLPYIHPANFRVPRWWLEPTEPTWDSWQQTAKSGVVYVTETERILDLRYTPIVDKGLFPEINVARGLGLLLYGLLRKSFDLPAIWNGPGHADVLAKMPRLLLADATCSTWTLGILASCLWPRVSENLILRQYPMPEYKSDVDTLRDPVLFLDGREIGRAVKISQDNLVLYQLSTMGNRARQLTPISIRQLTEPDWRKVFELPEEDGELAHG